ncbi:uncharacterized protein [Hetaerina americana]|uniref:uncharacterized protein isoform X17 n=1 Tax=Hetaerina americana TaxID=62018 RepID=UPI003A7F1607
MREAAEKRKELERQHAEALSQLRERQHEIQKYTKVSDADKPRQYETIEALQSKIRELEKKTELQNVRHEELLLEMASIKRSQMAAAASGAASSASASCSTPSSSPTMGKSTAPVPHVVAATSGSSPWKPPPRSVSTNQEVQTSPESGNSTPGYGLSSPYGTTNYPNIPSRVLPGPQLPSHKHQESTHSSHHIHHPQPQVPRQGRQIPQHPGVRSSVYQDDRFPSETRHSMLTRHHRARGEREMPSRPLSSAAAPLHPSSLPPQPPHSTSVFPSTTIPPHRAHTHRGGGAAMLSWRSASVSDMRRALSSSTLHAAADPQQLLYRGGLPVRPSHGSPYSVSSFAAPASHTLGALAPSSSTGARGLSPHATAMGPTAGSTLDSTSAEIDRIMAKIEQDNKILAELDKSRSTIGAANQPVSHLVSTSTESNVLSSNILGRMKPGVASKHQAYHWRYPHVKKQYLKVPQITYGSRGNFKMQRFSSAGDSPGRAGQMTSDSGFLSSSSLPGRSLSPMPMSATQASAGGTSLPMLLPQVPHSTSLIGSTATSGILGTGGVLGISSGIGGLSSLGPSSLSGMMSLQQQQQQQLAAVATAAGLNPLGGMIGSHLTGSAHSAHHGVHFGGVSTSHGTSPGRLMPQIPAEEALGKRIAEHSYIDLEDIMEEDEEGLSEQIVPAPKQLTLERQLNKSILIGWNPPDCPPGTIESYHVYVDGVLKTTVKATERTRALVEGVDSTRPHRISVRSITPNRRTSRDAACTMMIGKDIPLAPSCVKATNVTSTSAVISWMPCNSNYQHVVCVNNVEVRTVKAGVYRHTITGLAPNTTYRVTVRAKNIRAPYFDEKSSQHVERLSSHIDFRTLPKGCKGLPDPPVDIQVEAGPQDGTLLVTWLPVTVGASGIPGTSNGAPVTGYAVYADGKKVTDVDSPTGDHALIDINKLVGLNPKQVTVRTKSKDSQSSDSVPTPIPNHVLKGKMLKETSDQMKAERRMMKEERAMQMQQQQQQQAAMGMGMPPQQQGVAQQGQYRQYGPPPPGSAVPPHMRPHGARGGMMGRGGMRVDAHGQVVIETDENLSDKEIYPGAHMNIPSIVNKGFQHSEITKDSASEGNFSEDDYDPSRRGAPGMRGVHYTERMPRSHMDTRQGPRPQQVMGGPGPQGPRDMHDPYYDQRHQRHHHAPDGRERAVGGGPAPGSAFRGGPAGPDYAAGRGRGAVGPGGPGAVGGQHYAPGTGPPPAGGAREGGKRIRWFVALFDYDPTTMSPNPDACEEELPFSEGDSIKVYGEKDADGFYWGECRGRRGYVPYNMVVEVQEVPKNAEGAPAHGARGPGQAHGRGDRWGDTYANMPVKKMVALYDYDPQELSPNVDAEVELSFRTGNTIYVYGEMDDDGFYMGELDGVRGLVPSNFLTEAPGPQGPGGPGGMGVGPQPGMDYNGSRRGGREGRGGDMGNYDRTRTRGHGPGARGPPPPPRDGMRMMDPRDRRKDACLPPHIDSRADRQQDPRGRGDPRGDSSRRGGSGRGGWGPSPQQQQPMQQPTQQQQQQQQQMMGRGHPSQQQQQQGPGQAHTYRGPPPEPPGQEWGGQQQQDMGWTGDGMMMGGDPQQQMMGNYGAMNQPQQQGGPFQQGGQQPPMQQGQHPGDMGQMGRKPIKGIPAVVPDFAIPGNKDSAATGAPQATTSTGSTFPSAPNFMQKLTEVTGVGGGSSGAPGEGAMDNLLSKGKELIFKKFGLGD